MVAQRLISGGPMPIAAGLFLTTFLVSGPQPPAPPMTSVAAAQEPQPQDDPRTTPASTERPHEVGLGGFGGAGGGPSFRYFFGEQIGVDVNGGWYRPMNGGSTSSGTSFQVSPSMVVMLNKSHQLADLDLRPYVGGSVIYLNTPTTIARTTSTTGQRQSGVGMQAFGGVELT